MKGFWSYARADDTYDKVSNLRNAMQHALGQSKGARVSLYQDTTSTNWGADWKKKIDTELANCDFIIVVLTPYYFNRKHCRYEFESAVELKKPIFPIYFRNSDLLESDRARRRLKNSENDSDVDIARVAEKAASLQYKDFRKLRNKKIDSEESQNFIDEMADELIRELS